MLLQMLQMTSSVLVMFATETRADQHSCDENRRSDRMMHNRYPTYHHQLRREQGCEHLLMPMRTKADRIEKEPILDQFLDQMSGTASKLIDRDVWHEVL